MNISARHLPTSVTTTPLKAGELALPSINSVAFVDAVSVTIPNTVSSSSPASTISTVNPTYEKPISSVEGEVSEQADNVEKKAIDAIVKPISDEESDTEKTTQSNSSDSVAKENGETYSDAEIELISALKLRDAEVSAHERAHSSVGGQHAGSPSYSYKTGPDGVKYAVSGEVSIDTSRIAGDPQATLQKAQQIKAAALAPAEPSSQDRKVAAKADQMATVARSEILKANSGSESGATNTRYEASVSEHFTGQQLSIDPALDSDIQKQMNERSMHIDALYHRSSLAERLPSFEVQA
ncbi:putative metalloprotease CJM1_0395 family protein [Psychromonas hadalis]|uniref:putative metalloprotease CJM1_0395 family protein n=1 Tax=Psychromonas hadalis TaxID=211669 RepID=UPI0003B5536C|nr:putative metalloprotease CJM1_0395 family protein [Psychromonas hadalis]